MTVFIFVFSFDESVHAFVCPNMPHAYPTIKRMFLNRRRLVNIILQPETHHDEPAFGKR